MKKLSIILLVVLVLLSVVSCKKDKSEEMITNYEEFVKVEEYCRQIVWLLPSNETTISDTSSSTTTPISQSSLQDALEVITGDSAIEVSKITSQSGTVSVSNNGNENTREFKNVNISYKFISSKTSETTGTLTISGKFVSRKQQSRGDNAFADYSYELTINGTKYELSYYMSEKGKYESASVNGKDVEIRLLNANRVY